MRIESLSSLQTYQDCPRAYAYKYHEGLKPPLERYRFRMGMFVDRLLSTMLELEQSSLSTLQIQALWGELRDIPWEDHFLLVEGDWIRAIDVAHRAIKFIHSLQWETFKLDGKLCVQTELHREGLRGIIDWIAQDKKGNLCLVDFKVVQTKQDPKAQLMFDKQLSFYAWLLRDKVGERPIHMYQIRVLGKAPTTPKKVLCSTSTKQKKKYRPSAQKILTTWELWSNVAISCGIDPDSEMYTDTRIYLKSFIWDSLHRNFCTEEIQEDIAALLKGWQKKIVLDKQFFRNLRNYNLGPCNTQSFGHNKCPFVQPCTADLGNTPRPEWAIRKESKYA